MNDVKQQKIVPLQIYLTLEQKDFLSELSKLEVKTMSSIVRDALEKYFNEIVKKNDYS